MKPHILISADPLKEGENLKSPCKAVVHKAKFAQTWAPGEPLQMVDFRGCCWECLKAIPMADFLRGKRITLATQSDEV